MFVSAMPSAVTQVHRLFFAVQPDTHAASLADDLERQLRVELGLTGKRVAKERLHVTLHWLQDHISLPPDLLAEAMNAGSAAEMAPFDVVFDRVESLGDVNHGGPLVLTGTAGLASLRQFQRVLAAAMTDAGAGQYVRSSFKPHVTLLYDEQYVPRRNVPAVCWTVNELVLVESRVGKSQHIVLGRWPLQSRQLGFSDW